MKESEGPSIKVVSQVCTVPSLAFLVVCNFSCNLELVAGLFCPALKQQAAIGAPEAEGIGEGILNMGSARFIGNVVQVALRIGIFLIDCGWHTLVAQRQHRN